MLKKLFESLLLSFCLAGTAFASVDINTASQAELESVKGIGPARARAILEYRQQHGPFRSVDDLTKVKGIGPASVDKMRAEIRVGQAKNESKPEAQTAKR